MKKLLAALLAVTTVLSSASMIAYADDVHSAQLNKSNDQTHITATYTSVGSNPWSDTRWDDETTKVSVSVTWTEASFKYEFGTDWKPELKRYEDAPGWQKDRFTVTVENHSNCPVKATIGSKVLKRMGVGIRYDNSMKTANLTSAVNPEDTAANRNIAEFIPIATGTPTLFFDDVENFATFTVSIAANDPIINPEPTEPDTPATEPEEPPATEPDEGHKHHYVYDQFGRLVCTGCDSMEHLNCYDSDNDSVCDECGLECCFCPDCHYRYCECE